MAYDTWSYGLINLLTDKQNILLQNDGDLAVVRDNYPKAKFHFLVLPFAEELDTIYDLCSDHVELINEFELLGYNIVELIGCKRENFVYGFHAKPSMRR